MGLWVVEEESDVDKKVGVKEQTTVCWASTTQLKSVGVCTFCVCTSDRNVTIVEMIVLVLPKSDPAESGSYGPGRIVDRVCAARTRGARLVVLNPSKIMSSDADELGARPSRGRSPQTC